MSDQFVNQFNKLYMTRQTDQQKVRSKRTDRENLFKYVVAFADEVKKRDEIEEVIFPGVNPDEPECILKLKDGMGEIRLQYLAPESGEGVDAWKIAVDVNPRPLYNEQVASRKFYSEKDAEQINEYVAMCIGSMQAHAVPPPTLEQQLSRVKDLLADAFRRREADDLQAAMVMAQLASATALVSIMGMLVKLKGQIQTKPDENNQA